MTKSRAGTAKGGNVSTILRLVSDYLEANGQDRLIALLEDGLKDPKEAGSDRRSVNPSASEVDNEEVAAKLRVLRTRSEGENLLLGTIKNRRGLESLARHLQLPVQRDDTVDKLRSKIVENTIGSRLRSEAIQSGS